MSPAAQSFHVQEVCIRRDDTLAPGGLACCMDIGGPDAPLRQLTLLRGSPFDGVLDGPLIVDLLMLAIDATIAEAGAWTISRDPQSPGNASSVTITAWDRTPEPSPAVGIRFVFGREAPLSVVKDPLPVVRDLLHALSFDGTTFAIT